MTHTYSLPLPPSAKRTAAICFECGSKADHAHHVVPRVMGGVRTIPLCTGCHGKVHGRAMCSSELTKRGMAKKKDSGARIGSIPYGYSCMNGMLVSDAKEEELMGIARELRDSGATYRAIAERLGSIGHVNKRGAKLNPATIYKICTRL